MSAAPPCLAEPLASPSDSAADAPRPTAPSPVVPVLLLAALFALPLVVALRPIGKPVIDPDVWWHLRTGQWVVEHHTVPTNDPFTTDHKPWVAYSWLYEVVLFGLYQSFGLAGVVVYRAAGALAVVGALYHLVSRRDGHFLRAVAWTAVGTLAIAPLFSERPWLLTIALTIFTTDVVLELRAGKATRLAWLLPAAFAFWASTHIQFVYGLIVLGLACAAPVLDRALGRLPPDTTPADSAAVCCSAGWRRLLLLGAACLLATLLNPYHVRIYGVVLEYATQPGPFRYVNELKAAEFREPTDWLFLALGATAVFALGRRRRLDTFEVLLVVLGGVLAFHARRDLWVLVLASLTVLSGTDRGPVPAAFRVRLNLRHGVAVVGLLAGFAAALAWGRDLSERRLHATVAEAFPARATEVVRERGYPGPLYNDFNWGGFLMWQLPQQTVALDGRTNLHGDERILRIGNTWAGGPGWKDDPDLAAAGVVIADVQTPLAGLLLTDERFTLVHDDPVARVFVRRGVPGP
jgi:hypothetical protein